MIGGFQVGAFQKAFQQVRKIAKYIGLIVNVSRLMNR